MRLFLWTCVKVTFVRSSQSIFIYIYIAYIYTHWFECKKWTKYFNVAYMTNKDESSSVKLTNCIEVTSIHIFHSTVVNLLHKKVRS
jgi:hypothetical protein